MTEVPSEHPSAQPSQQPSAQPSYQPSGYPSYQPSGYPSYQPSGYPSGYPSYQPSGYPSYQPSGYPSGYPSYQPSGYPSYQPSGYPSYQPSGYPSGYPSYQPSGYPSYQPSGYPSTYPSYQPSGYPSYQPSGYPSAQPSGAPAPGPVPVPMPSGPSTAPGAAQLTISNVKATATALHLRLELDLTNSSTQTFPVNTTFFTILVTPTGEGAQTNYVRRPNQVAITPGLTGHVIEVEQLDPGDYSIDVSVQDHDGNLISNSETTTVHEAGHAPHTGPQTSGGQAADVHVAITRVEHISGREYRTHYTLRNNGSTPIQPGLQVIISGDSAGGGTANQLYDLQSALAAGASQEHYLTLMLTEGEVWTLRVDAGGASDTWTVSIDQAGNATHTG